MKVRFNLKDRNGLILLKFRYIRGGLPFVFSTRQHIKPKDWNKKTMRAIVRDPKAAPHLADLNRLLQRMEDVVLSVYRKNAGVNKLTNELFREALTNTFIEDQAGQITVMQFLRETMANQKRAKETISNYRHTANTLDNFAGSCRVRCYLDEINHRWLDKFTAWGYREGYSVATVGKFVSVTKAAVNLARRLGMTENTAVNERGFSIRKTPGNKKKIALYDHEVKRIEKIKWDQIETFEGMTRYRLEKVADIILASCETGLRHSDMHKITKNSIVQFRSFTMVQVWTKKTDKPVTIPASERLIKIMEKHRYKLPTATRGEVLRVGRQVLKLAEIDREVAVRETKGGTTTVKHYPLWEKFSAHVTRRTFARNAYMKDPDLLPAIQTIIGHSTQAQTLEYIDVEGMLTAEHYAKRMQRAATQ